MYSKALRRMCGTGKYNLKCLLVYYICFPLLNFNYKSQYIKPKMFHPSCYVLVASYNYSYYFRHLKKKSGLKRKLWQMVSRRLMKGAVTQGRCKSVGLGATTVLPLSYVSCLCPVSTPIIRKGREVAQSCPTLSDPMDCSLPGSTIHGIFQAKVQEWGAIAFSDNEKRTRQNLKSPPALTISIRFKIKSMCIDLKVCLQHTCFTEQDINTADVLPLKFFGSKVICSMFISALTQWFSDQILTSKSYSNNQC